MVYLANRSKNRLIMIPLLYRSNQSSDWNILQCDWVLQGVRRLAKSVPHTFSIIIIVGR